MKSRRTRTYIVTVAILFAVGTYLVINGIRTAVTLPDIGSRAGNARADSEFLNTQEAIEYFKLEVRKNPDRLKNYVQLAQLYLQQARVTGRHHAYVILAGEMLDEVVKRDADNLEGLLTRASMLMTLHQFDEALNLAQEAVRRSPYTAMGWGVLSDARKELGDYSGAVEACDKMLNVRPDLRSYSRAAHLREIHGDLRGAKTAMELAANAGVVGLENHAWTLYQLGNLYLTEGKLDTAEMVFKGILRSRANYPHALSGLARIDALRGAYDSAIQQLLQAYDFASEHRFMEQLVEVYLASGKTGTAEVLMESVLEAFKQHEKQRWNVNLEFAEFCGKYNIHLEEALQRAGEEYRFRPDNIDVLQTYAWLLFRNGRAGEASEMIKKAMRFNAPDARLYYRAGLIASETGRSVKARAHLEKALALNQYFGLAEKMVAKRTLGNLDKRLEFSKMENPDDLAASE